MRKRMLAAAWRCRFIGMLAIAVLCLSGCARYEVAIQFDHANHGTLTQHVRLAEPFTNLSGATAQQWLSDLEHRARQVEGQVQHREDQDLWITIPFHNGADLEAKFNQFFQVQSDDSNRAIAPVALPSVQSQLQLQQNNFLLVLRNHLTYDLDLTALGILSDQGDVLVRPGSLLDLEFRLSTPWGARVIDTGNPQVPLPQVQPPDHQLVWTLLPGQVNHLEVVFWLPSPIGLGTVAIALLTAVAWYWKSKQAPSVSRRAHAESIEAQG